MEKLEHTAQQPLTFCQKWAIKELSLFGSSARGEARHDSDIDLMVELGLEAKMGLWEFVPLKEELEALLGRKVDLVNREVFRNLYRKASIGRASESSMQPNEDDAGRLWDMRRHAQLVIAMTDGASVSEFEPESPLRLAVERAGFRTGCPQSFSNLPARSSGESLTLDCWSAQHTRSRVLSH